jgi:hypothetical protein
VTRPSRRELEREIESLAEARQGAGLPEATDEEKAMLEEVLNTDNDEVREGLRTALERET